MAFITMDDKDLRRYARDLKRMASEALPFANREAINTAAKQTEVEWRKLLGRKLILRNRWTLGSVRREFAKQKEIRKQQAVVGSVEPYLETQEFGGSKVSLGKHGVPIPTHATSGEAPGKFPRQRPVKGRLQLRQLRIQRAHLDQNPKTRNQKNLILILIAARRGGGNVLLKTDRGTGIYQVRGSKARRTKRRRTTGAKVRSVKKLYSLDRRRVSIPAHPTLGPAVDVIKPRLPGIWKKSLKKQLIRKRLFRR